MSKGSAVSRSCDGGRGSYLAAFSGLRVVVAEGPPQQAEMVWPSLCLFLGRESWARGDLQDPCCLTRSSVGQNCPLFHRELKPDLCAEAPPTGTCDRDAPL